MIFSMGSILVKITYYLGEFDNTMSVMNESWCWGVGHLLPAHEYHGALIGITARIVHRAYRTMWCAVFVFFLLA
jgi:hypothetical protein